MTDHDREQQERIAELEALVKRLYVVCAYVTAAAGEKHILPSKAAHACGWDDPRLFLDLWVLAVREGRQLVEGTPTPEGGSGHA